MFGNLTTQRRLDRQYDREQAQMDSLTPKQAAEKIKSDPISERMAIVATSQMRMQSLYVVFMLAAMLSEEDYDDEELLPSELLDSLMLDAFSDDDDDDSDDGDIDENVKITFSAHVSDALSSLGVEDDIIDDLFDSDIEVADAATLAAAETVLENMPDDGAPFDEFVASFAYGEEPDDGDEGSFDSVSEPQFDAVKKKLRAGKKTVKKVNGKTLQYKAVKAVRDGEIVVVNKRISGNIKLSAAQKASLKKARRKSGNSAAIRKQMKSLGKGMRANIYKGNQNRLKALQLASVKRHSKSLGI